MARLHLEIVTPEKPILKEEVDEVVVPGLLGEFGVLPGHTTFLAELGKGALAYLQGGQPRSLEIAGGFAEIREDRVTVLADAAHSG